MRVLLTGGSGRLGTELRALLVTLASVEILAPRSSDLDVRDADAFHRWSDRAQPDVIVHAAAYTDVSAAERERSVAYEVNVVGTRNAASAAAATGAKLVHVSTDYVFWGDSGGYSEDDTPGPVRNYYALTKLLAEEAAKAADDHLVVRTSFRPREWPYERAFTDLFTSQDYVDVIAPMVAMVVVGARSVPHDVLHVATERKSVFELASRRAPGVAPASKREASVPLPDDVSLDVTRFERLRAELELAWRQAGGQE